MKIRSLLATVVLLAPALAFAQRPLPVGTLSVAAPASIGEIDVDKMKGQPAKLAWSPDGKELYVQLLEGDFGRNGAVRHVVFTVADGKQKSVDVMPAWAGASWAAKSDRASPDNPAYQIAVESVPRTERTVSAPMGGELARGGVGGGGDIGGGAGGTSAGDAIANAANAQTVMVHSMKLGKEVIGEFANTVIVPGLTFGWGPTGSHVVAYATPKVGKIVIMDTKGNKQEVEGTKEALLPAWSPDGARLAWMRKDGRKKYSVLVANVTAR